MTPQKLKSSILQLAIQGKLVEQRPEEGTGEELYRQIQAEKQRLIKAGTIKKEKSLPEITEDEKPFDTPEGWRWVRLQSVVYNHGQTVPQNEFAYIDIGSIDNKKQRLNNEDTIIPADKTPSRARKIVKYGDILYSTVRPYLHNMCIVDRKFSRTPIASTGFAAMTCHTGVYNEYLFYYLMSPTFDSYANDTENSKGVAYPAINDNRLYRALISLPPLAEQKRIVARIKELLPYIDRYEEAWSKLEDFNKRFPVDMQKSILQMAIQGKLVEQRPEEGTGEELYRQIQAEKQQLIKARKIKREKPLPEIAEDEMPFEIPESWKWVRLPEIGELNRGKSKHRPRNAPELYINGSMPMIQTGDVARANKYITEWSTMYNDIGVSQSRIWNAGTLCMTIAANIGDVAILSFDACFPDSVVGFNAYKPILTNEYFMYGLMCYKTILDTMSRSTAQKNINLDIISQVAFPLPPLAEQKRIVAKLEEILPLCEKLKK